MPKQGDKVPFETHNQICRDLDKAQAILKKINYHFKDHQHFTRDDYDTIKREEYQAEVRRNMPEDEGAPALNIEFIDLP